MRDSAKSGNKNVKRIEELEFQRNILIPKEYREQDIPQYFKRPYGRVLLAGHPAAVTARRVPRDIAVG